MLDTYKAARPQRRASGSPFVLAVSCLLLFSIVAIAAPVTVREMDLFDASMHKSPWNTTYSCFRVPSSVQSFKTGTLFVFVEARIGNCEDQAPKDIVSRRSTDGGASWSPLELLAGPELHRPRPDSKTPDFSARNPCEFGG